MPTEHLYLDDGDVFAADARVLAVQAEALACDRTCFYPGGGGQPPDQGVIDVDGMGSIPIVSVRAEDDGTVWHVGGAPVSPEAVGRAARLSIDRARRLMLTRYHTVLHVLNTTALRTYAGWITGVQIGVDYSRIDFTLEDFSAAVVADLQARVNAVLAEDHALAASYIPEAEFRARDDLRRTLIAEPPIVEGRVRIVTIAGFDAQACGGTHVHSTRDVGQLSIFRTENKGRRNKRLYLRLTP
jgi:misacylated tRNA(Ala) deacylase